MQAIASADILLHSILAATLVFGIVALSAEGLHPALGLLAVPALAGQIRVFAFSDLTYTEGPNKGEKANGTQAYIYKVAGDKFIEFWGILGDADSPILTHRWKRQPSA